MVFSQKRIIPKTKYQRASDYLIDSRNDTKLSKTIYDQLALHFPVNIMMRFVTIMICNNLRNYGALSEDACFLFA